MPVLPLPDIVIPDGNAEGVNGYYLLEVDNDDSRDYNLTIIDSGKKEVVI